MTIRRLVALFALAITLPYVTLLAVNLFGDLADEYAGAYRLARVLADSTASDTARFVADTKGLAAHLATHPALRALNTGRCDRFLTDLLPTLQHVTNVLTVDANGRLLCSATPITAQTPKSVPPHYWFDEVRRTRATVVGRPARGFITGKWVVTIAEPILDARGRFLGAVGIAMELVRFRPLRGGEDVPEGTAIRILNRDGIVIASMLDEDRWIGRDVSDHAAIKAIIAKGEGSLRMPGLDGIDRLIAFRTVRGTNWIAGAGVPAQAAFAQFDRRLRYTLLSFVAAILVSISIGT